MHECHEWESVNGVSCFLLQYEVPEAKNIQVELSETCRFVGPDGFFFSVLG